MKAVILAGGYGTRISEETHLKPKPMVEVGGKPILWHIMKLYSHYNINDFIICLGYKGYVIKEYFANYFLYSSDVTFDFKQNKTIIHNNYSEPWTVTLVDTGEHTMTGGRLKRVQEYVGNETFCFTYGDGVGDVNIDKLIASHRRNNVLCTVTTVQPPGRFGSLKIEGNTVAGFKEKPKGEQGWINGGFFVLEPSVFSYIDGDETTWEKEPIERLSVEGNVKAFFHERFWHPMDTLRDKNFLEKLWSNGEAPWKVWSN